MALTSLKAQLQRLAIPVTDPGLKPFVPEGQLAGIFTLKTLETALSLPEFNIPDHKVSSTASIVIIEAQKILAICLELNAEHDLIRFIESDLTDAVLPLDSSRLGSLIPNSATRFEEVQWRYVAYRFRKGLYQKTLDRKRILPFISQRHIGGGGFSKVYKVVVHPAHQDLTDTKRMGAVQLVRKELEPCAQSERAESELLFLLGSIRHPNIVELLASYTQDGISSLIFQPAELDLHEFLLLPERPVGFEDDLAYFYAMHGLSAGLHYLHNFGLGPTATRKLHGYHHDIKPRNVLVRGTSFILADFGFAKLKAVDEDSQTLWKNTTFEYGPPECRDPGSFAPGSVGRGFDIWSLACVYSEVLTHLEHGSQGVVDLRSQRIIEHRYGQVRCFHDGQLVSSVVAQHLDNLGSETRSSSVKSLVTLLRAMFSAKSNARPTSETVQQCLSRATIDILVEAVNHLVQLAIDSHAGTINPGIIDRNLYVIQLRLQKNRLVALTQALSLKSPFGIPPDHQLYDFFDHIYQRLFSAFKELKAENHFENAEDNQDFILKMLDQTINDICRRLSREVRRSIDDRFRILTISTSELPPLQQLATVNLYSEELHDVGSLAAIKYMTLLLEKHESGPNPNCRIQPSLVRKSTNESDPAAQPDSWLYSYGYRKGEERPVIVEPIPYWERQHDMDSEDFQHAIQVMFRRVQELVTVLQYNAKPSEFRTLDCLGAFHDPQRKAFGIVYAFPWEDKTPVRLNKLLRHGKKCDNFPDLKEKLTLAKVLVACVQSFHMSGWVHKNISSLNVIFFANMVQGWSTLHVIEPYMIGFDHSRKDGNGEYSQGPRLQGSKEYLHPDYRQATTGYSRSYDYYSLGLVLLEIGTWTSLSNIYERDKTASPTELRATYIQQCTDHLGKTMGPTYMSATKTCLEYDAGDDDVREQLGFQAEVVDKLNRCVF